MPAASRQPALEVGHRGTVRADDEADHLVDRPYCSAGGAKSVRSGRALVRPGIECVTMRSTKHSMFSSWCRGGLDRPFLGGWRRQIFLLDPAGLDARLHDQRFGLVAREIESVEGAGIAYRLAVLAFAPAEKVVGGATRQVLDRFDPVLAQLHQHGGGDARDLFERVLDAELFALVVELGFLSIEIVAGARLQFTRGVLVETLDPGELLFVHRGKLLDRVEAFRSEQLADHLVDVERLDEQLGAFFEFGLPVLRFLLLGDDVDVPAGELRSEPDILSAPADGKRKLLVGDDHFHALAVLVEHDLSDFGGRQRVDHEVGGVRRPRDDVDLLALQLVDHGLHARTAHADAGADRINRRIPGNHRDFRARTRVARHCLHLHDAVVDFRHFLREQLGHELWMRAREKYLRPARLAAYVVDESADAVAVAERFSRQHFVSAHDRLAAAEIDDHVAVFDPLDDTVDDIGNAVLVLLILPVALGLAHLLHDHLLRRLGGDAAIFERRQGLGDVVADLSGGVALFRLFERDLRRVVFDLIHHQEQTRQSHLAGLWIDLGADFGLAAIARACRLLDRILHGGDDDVAVDRLLAGDRLGDLQQFEPVGADGHRSFSFVLSPAAVIERRGLDILQSSFGRRAREDRGW